jgi:Tfp pilus assembly protein PilF
MAGLLLAMTIALPVAKQYIQAPMPRDKPKPDAPSANAPAAWHAHYTAALHAYNRRNMPAAMALVERAIEINPPYHKAYGDRALLDEQMGQAARAEADWAAMRRYAR